MINKKVYLLFGAVVCIFLIGCKSRTREEMILQEIQAIDNKLVSEEYMIGIKQFIPRDGIVYDADKKNFIKIDHKNIQLQIPDIEDAQSNIFAISSTLENYEFQKKDKGVTLISGTFKTANDKIYNLSIIVTQFGDATIYLSEGFYNSISFVGELK